MPAVDKKGIESAFAEALSISKKAERKKILKILSGLTFSLTISSALLTTLPSQTLNIIFSWLTASGLILMMFLFREQFKRPTLWLFLTLSICSGCAGPIFHDSSATEEICIDISGGPCRSGEAKAIGFLGLGLDQVNIETAKENGQITKAISTETVRGYGLISMAQVRVWGE